MCSHAFLPRINNSPRSRDMVNKYRRDVMAPQAQHVAQVSGRAQTPRSTKAWAQRLHQSGRRQHEPDIFRGAQTSELSVAERSYLRAEHRERERNWAVGGGTSDARSGVAAGGALVTQPLPALPRVAPPTRHDASTAPMSSAAQLMPYTSGSGATQYDDAYATGSAASTYAPFASLLARLSLPAKGMGPPAAPVIMHPTIVLPRTNARSGAQRSFSHFGAGAAVWWHKSNDIVAELTWAAPPKTGASPVLQYQVEYCSRVHTDLLTTTESRLSAFVSHVRADNDASRRAGAEAENVPWDDDPGASWNVRTRTSSAFGYSHGSPA